MTWPTRLEGKRVFPESYPIRMAALRTVYMDLANELGVPSSGRRSPFRTFSAGITTPGLHSSRASKDGGNCPKQYFDIEPNRPLFNVPNI
jgi:hypothetical protein